MRKTAYFVIGVDAFRADVFVFVNYTSKQLLAFCKRRMPAATKDSESLAKFWERHDRQEGCGGCASMLGDDHVVILRTGRDSLENIADTVAHEMVHVSGHIMQQLHIPQSADTEEVRAHLTGFLTGKTLKGIQRYCR